MIALRGGVDNLGLPRIVLQMMVWYDAFMSAESKTPRLFAELPSRLAVPSFTSKEAMAVTDAANPNRHRHPRYNA
jgi:hypothetical protein